MRALYQETDRSHPAALAHFRHILALGGQIRTLDELNDKLVICDERVAFVPVSESWGTAALEIREPGLIRFLVSAFDVAWGRATPLTDQSIEMHRPKITSSLQKKIIRLVVEGHTDSVIASRLGTSTRTVAEHVRRVSSQLGSRSRAELGYLVSKTNLLQQLNVPQEKEPRS
ncbi:MULTISPECIES: helix-turn-helix transcriptional regulator [unclassified Streptomyces]|uniref:helix-turn-helix transcriptional regulator n=1 Tax=unclassified Streptomyces TaxID=2593676 RepID=UPI002E262F4A|nr:helix-turn-helix transcriptional regulator [Streptomyces sp. NBC_01001]